MSRFSTGTSASIILVVSCFSMILRDSDSIILNRIQRT